MNQTSPSNGWFNPFTLGPIPSEKKCDIAMEHGHRKFIDLRFLKILNTAIFSTVNCENTKGYYQDDNHPWEWQWVGINHRWLGYGIPGCHTPGAASKWFISPWAVAHVIPIYMYIYIRMHIYIFILRGLHSGDFPLTSCGPPVDPSCVCWWVVTPLTRSLYPPNEP